MLRNSQKLQSSNSKPWDYFGTSVSISENRAMVVSTTNGNGQSAVLLGIGTKRDTKVYDSFGYSVSISGKLAIVGAPDESSGGPSTGAAYLFKLNDDDKWESLQTLQASDGKSGDPYRLNRWRCLRFGMSS